MNETITPKETLSFDEMRDHAEILTQKKLNYCWQKSFILSVLGGVFISFGAILSVIVSAGSSNMSYGVTRLLMGIVFSLGLILVIVGGAELFTGSTIISIAVVNKKAKLRQLIKNWIIVYLGNFVGAILISLLIFFSKQYTFGNGIMGINTLNIALSKIHHSFFESIFLGILCNMLVCLAIWLTYSTKSISGKIMAIIFPVTAFVAAGFEHSVANMYYVPIALLIKNFDSNFITSINLTDLTLNHFLINNLLPVTIGNIIGGVVIWLTFNFLYKKNA